MEGVSDVGSEGGADGGVELELCGEGVFSGVTNVGDDVP